MPSFRRNPGDLHATGSATNHQDLLWRVGGRKPVTVPLELASTRGIHQTGNPIVASASAPAHLITGYARANVLRSVVQSLAGHMWVGDLTPNDTHHIRLSRADYRIGILGSADVAFGLHPSVVAHLLERLGKRRTQFIGVHESRHDLIEVEITAAAGR